MTALAQDFNPTARILALGVVDEIRAYAEQEFLSDQNSGRVILPNRDDLLRVLRVQSEAAAVEGVVEYLRRVPPLAKLDTFPRCILSAAQSSIVSEQGYHHYDIGIPNQDYAAIKVEPVKRFIVAALSDGVTVVKGAALGARFLVDAAQIIIDDLLKDRSNCNEHGLLNKKFLGRLHYELCKAILDLADHLHLHPFVLLNNILSATLQIGIFREQDSILIAVGDGFFEINGTLHRCQTGSALEASSAPPLLSHAIVAAVVQLIEHDQSEGAERLRAISRKPTCKKSLAFYICKHGSTSELFKDSVKLLSDGAKHTDLCDMDSFPVRKLIDGAQDPGAALKSPAMLYKLGAVARNLGHRIDEVLKILTVVEDKDIQEIDKIPYWATGLCEKEDEAYQRIFEFFHAEGKGEKVMTAKKNSSGVNYSALQALLEGEDLVKLRTNLKDFLIKAWRKNAAGLKSLLNEHSSGTFDLAHDTSLVFTEDLSQCDLAGHAAAKKLSAAAFSLLRANFSIEAEDHPLALWDDFTMLRVSLTGSA